VCSSDLSELPGTYYQPHGRVGGSTLELAADRRFSVVERCSGQEIDRDQGTWGLEGDTLVLQPERAADRGRGGGVDVRYLPVKWGNRLLLIDENGMPGFCADVRGESPHRCAGSYVKRADPEANPGEGEPLIPDRFREFYEKGPVRARVAAIGDDGTLTLDQGAADRLRPGMRMALWRPESIDPVTGVPRHLRWGEWIELIVESVGERDAVARVHYFRNSERRVQVGDQFTTGERWFSVAGTGVPRLPEPPHRPRGFLSGLVRRMRRS